MNKKEENNKYKKAVALKYNQKRDQAPKIIAKGKGVIAQQIIKIAREHNIPLYEDRDLAEVLTLLDINEEIPEELYQVVAEVLVFVYALNQKWKKKEN